MANSAIWSVRKFWFATKKEAVAFCQGANIPEDEVMRRPIGCYLNPKQLVTFLKENEL